MEQNYILTTVLLQERDSGEDCPRRGYFSLGNR